MQKATLVITIVAMLSAGCSARQHEETTLQPTHEVPAGESTLHSALSIHLTALTIGGVREIAVSLVARRQAHILPEDEFTSAMVRVGAGDDVFQSVMALADRRDQPTFADEAEAAIARISEWCDDLTALACEQEIPLTPVATHVISTTPEALRYTLHLETRR